MLPKKPQKTFVEKKIAGPYEKGFTLIELMIAVFVLSTAYLAAASMQIAAVNENTAAEQLSEGMNLAQSKMEELMALEYSQSFTDIHLLDDVNMPTAPEPFTDVNANGLWDLKEPFMDLDNNGIWNPAHMDKNIHFRHIVSWSVFDDTNANKYVRVYVTRKDIEKICMFTCIKSRR